MSEVPTRRDALLSTALMFMLPCTSNAGAASRNTMSEALQQDRVARSTTRVRGFADPEMDFQLLRSLGAANYMGGAVGEILAAVANIKDGDPPESTFNAPACITARLSTTLIRSPIPRGRTG